jgi:F-type H+-transporting ATPase subunit b
MLIDWFTVGAQVVNFVILVVVLKFVLFDRVVAAMDQRQAEIAARIHEAEDREEAALIEAERYRSQQRALDEERTRRLDDAEAEAAVRRRELLDEARHHVDALRLGWEAALGRERASLLEEVRRRTGEQVCTVSRRALADLADTDLDTQMVRVAVDRLRSGAAELDPLAEERRGGAGPVVVRTSHPLPDGLATTVSAAVAEAVGCERDDVELSVAPGLVCGLEIVVGGWSVGWSVDGYLDAVAEELEDLLPRDVDADVDAGAVDPADRREASP